jgi:D-xylose transport system permease protein
VSDRTSTPTEDEQPSQTPTETGAATPPTATALEDAGLQEHVAAWWQRLRAGELGNLPIIVGLLVIVAIFSSLNPRFVSSVNFVNLLIQTAPLAVIAMGVVFVLLIAEVDLSVGYLSGVAAVVLARLLGEEGWPVALAIVAVLLMGATAGFVQGWLVAKMGLPSLIVTLGGLVGFNGLVLILISGRGTMRIQDPFVVGLVNRFLPTATSYLIVAVGVAGYAAVMLNQRRRRQAASLPSEPISVLGIRLAVLAVLGGATVYFASLNRGIPFVALLLIVLLVGLSTVLMRTAFGRHVYAVGGNREAARRAGIEVLRVRIACFMISSTMAALGGILFASRLRSVDTGAGGGQIELNAIAAAVIGGTSLFGGRGKISAALFGAFVIMSVDNGMGLLGLSSGAKFVVTAAVLLAAVGVDSVARRGRAKSGLA